MEEVKCEQVVTLQGGKWDKMHDIAKRVYGTNGISPTLHTCGGEFRTKDYGRNKITRNAIK